MKLTDYITEYIFDTFGIIYSTGRGFWFTIRESFTTVEREIIGDLLLHFPSRRI